MDEKESAQRLTMDEEEIAQRLTLLPNVLQDIDNHIKVALVLKGYVDLDSFPTDNDGWKTLQDDCGIINPNLNIVKNRITNFKSQSRSHSQPKGN